MRKRRQWLKIGDLIRYTPDQSLGIVLDPDAGRYNGIVWALWWEDDGEIHALSAEHECLELVNRSNSEDSA